MSNVRKDLARISRIVSLPSMLHYTMRTLEIYCSCLLITINIGAKMEKVFATSSFYVVGFHFQFGNMIRMHGV